MGYIADVVSLATIQSVWGNQIRDRAFHIFDTMAERDSKTAVVPDGVTCRTADNGYRWVKAGGAWYRADPLALQGARQAWGIPVGVTVTGNSITNIVGFRRALVTYNVLIDTGTSTRHVDLRLTLMLFRRGAIKIGQATWTASVDNTRADAQTLPTMLTMSVAADLSPAGDDITAQVRNDGVPGGTAINTALLLYADETNNLTALVT